MTNKHKIVILGAGEGQLPLIHRAKDAGWYTIIVSPKGDYPGFALADECCYADISDKEALLTITREHHADAIATDQTDVSVPALQYVAETLHLPHIECKDIYRFQLKSFMRQVCAESGLPTIPYEVVATVEEATQFMCRHVSAAVIIKPVDSQGSRGVQRVNTIAELNEAWSETIRYSKSKRVIIEQFVEGQEIEVDTVMRDGQILGVLIGDVFNFDLKNTFSGYERKYPTAFPQSLQNYICHINARTLCALGLRTGWTHGEYIVTKDGEVYLIEVGARGGGNYIGSHIVRAMLGVGTDEMAFRTAIGDNSFYDKIGLRNAFCAYKCFFLPAGTITKIDIDTAYIEQPYVIAHNLWELSEGKLIQMNTDKTSRYTVVLTASTQEELDARLADVPNHIHVWVENKNGMEEAIWR